MPTNCEHQKRFVNCKICSGISCAKCNVIFSKNSYDRHILTCKPILTKNCEHEKQLRNCKICLPFECKECNKVYSKECFRSHKCGYKRPEKKQYICSLCPENYFRDSWVLKRHYKQSPKKHKEFLSEQDYNEAMQKIRVAIENLNLQTLKN